MNQEQTMPSTPTGNAVENTIRGLSYGEKAVGLNFNPSNITTVQKVKQLYAEIIDLCNDLIPKGDGVIPNNEHTRLLKIAITEAQTAQMWAFKAITWK